MHFSGQWILYQTNHSTCSTFFVSSMCLLLKWGIVSLIPNLRCGTCAKAVPKKLESNSNMHRFLYYQGWWPSSLVSATTGVEWLWLTCSTSHTNPFRSQSGNGSPFLKSSAPKNAAKCSKSIRFSAWSPSKKHQKPWDPKVCLKARILWTSLISIKTNKAYQTSKTKSSIFTISISSFLT